jgi:acetyl esterase/lipase
MEDTDMHLRVMNVLLMSLVAIIPCNALMAQSPRDGRAELDIPFVEGGDHDQQLDLYTPARSDFPTILFVHEGSLTSGDRKNEPYARMCQTFQGLGIACAATNYRLAPSHKWPAQPNDVVAAFRWLKKNIGARGGDPGRIFLFGHSSGCSIVAVVATDARYLKKQGLSPEDIAGVIPMGCRLNDYVEVTDRPPSTYEASWVPADRVDDYMKGEVAFVSLEQRNAAVPAAHVTRRLPPTLVLIAEAERFFPPILRDAAEFVGRALVHGAEAELAILDNRRHMTAIQMMVTVDDSAVLKVVEFVRAH